LWLCWSFVAVDHGLSTAYFIKLHGITFPHDGVVVGGVDIHGNDVVWMLLLLLLMMDAVVVDVGIRGR
jgi:hypothetical protein